MDARKLAVMMEGLTHLKAARECLGTPKVVALVGPETNKEAFEREARRLECEGCIVLTPHAWKHGGHVGESPECGWPDDGALAALRTHSVTLADEVLVINVGGFIGAATAMIRHAVTLGKKVVFLEPGRQRQRQNDAPAAA